jgi:hypothetical protein
MCLHVENEDMILVGERKLVQSSEGETIVNFWLSQRL